MTFLEQTLSRYTGHSMNDSVSDMEKNLRDYLTSKIPAELNFLIDDITKYILSVMPKQISPQYVDTFVHQTLKKYLQERGLSDGILDALKSVPTDFKINVVLPADTKKTLYLVAGTIGAGFALNGILNYLANK